MQIKRTIARAGRLTAIIAVLAVLSASLGTVQGAVLCIAPDGSLAIEAAGPDGACLSRPIQTAGDAAQIADDCPHGAAECAGCTDLALDRLPAGIHNLAGSRRLPANPPARSRNPAPPRFHRVAALISRACGVSSPSLYAAALPAARLSHPIREK